ncbi:TPA: type III restriction endonuclease subunit R [Legionella pneumophila subsp. pneumophila]|nr:type III restriction endonuclease subunit R [Legionella pneumophila subsp. pneumophila]
MNRHVNAIAGRLSLRPPQRKALEILDRIIDITSLKNETDAGAALKIINQEFSSVSDFDRDFPSICFSLATGVGKTRLMGAFISYLHLAHGINNFFVLAPNLTIYNKLIQDFSQQNHPKYVFKGISEFAINGAKIITGDNYEKVNPSQGTMFDEIHINIFNIAKITSEVRGGKAPRIKRLSEYIGESYFDYLAGLPDLVLLMDESHRYRASGGLKAINELKPILGLELTATPFIESTKGAVKFNNIIYDYPLGQAIADGYVKEPAVVTRKDFNPAGMSQAEIERMKLEDGVRLHESIKVELETYARETNNTIVKPFLLVIARDTTHASELLNHIQSDAFFEGRYKTKVIQVDSSKSGAEEEQMITRLLKVEHTAEPTEIVIHVNMLKEGWDVTNLYTIVPLRAAHARILIEQSIGRGLRLPYGRRTGVAAVDRLNIVGHDRFQEIIDEANRPGSLIQLQTLELDIDVLGQKKSTVISQPILATKLGLEQPQISSSSIKSAPGATSIFTNIEDQKVAEITYNVIKKFENKPRTLPTIEYLKNPEIVASIVKEVEAKYTPLTHIDTSTNVEKPNIHNVVTKTVELVTQQTIDIPRILVVPKGEVKSGFKPFTLKLDALKYPAISEELWIQYLRTNERDSLAVGQSSNIESRLENYIVYGLLDFDDISYDNHADLLYDLATQTVNHFRSYLPENEIPRVLSCYQRDIARFIHSQMQNNYWEDVVDYDVVITKGFTELKTSAYTQSESDPLVDFRNSSIDKSNISKYLFNGFNRCLYAIQKFDSDSERKMAIILDRDAIKWFKPAKGQFQLFYKSEHDQPEYLPDFVAETANSIFMIEIKKRKEMKDTVVLAKQEAATTWCNHATDHAKTYNGKPWRYLLIPHDEIAENNTLNSLADRFCN